MVELSNLSPRAEDVSDGTVGPYSFTFKIWQDEDIEVYVDNSTTKETLTTDYTVSFTYTDVEAQSGTITFESGSTPANGVDIVISRNVVNTPITTYTQSGGFRAKTVNKSWQRLWAKVQEVNLALTRSLTRSPASTSSADLTLPEPSAGKPIGWNADEDGLENKSAIGMWQGDWTVSTDYVVLDVVKDAAGDAGQDNLYTCLVEHTSVDLSDDLAASKWELIINVVDAVSAKDDAETAQAAAETAQTAAETAETNAETAETNAAASYDSFDDRYLGAKASDPTLDNDSNTLLDGAMYFDTTLDAMKVYDLGGTSWLLMKPTSAEQTNIDTVAGDAADIATVAADGADIGTVAGISANVTTVAGISANVTTVAADGTDIGTVATDIADIITVAADIADIVTVAADGTDIGIVAADGTDIGIVSGISSDVTTVAGVSANVTTVAGIDANVTTVAGISSDVTTVAADASDIGIVAADGTDIGIVSGISANVTTVAGISSDVTTVAADASDIGIVAADSADIATVATDIADIITVAADGTDIGIVAADSADIATVAGISSGVTSVAAQMIGWTYDTTTAMADPGSGTIRLNNASPASVTAIAVDDLDDASTDVSAYVITWDDSTSTNKGTITIRKAGTTSTFAIYTISGLTDNAGWTELAVTYITGNGSFSNSDTMFVHFTRTGLKGDTGSGSGDLLAVNNLSDLGDAGTARGNLGLTIGSEVQAYDNTILVDADIGTNVQAYDATYLVDADIGGSVQAYDAVLDGTTASFTTADETKLDNIEATANITDEANVTSSLDGATLTGVTVATGDKVLIQDVSNSDNLKTVTTQAIADLFNTTNGIQYVIDGGGSVIATGLKGYLEIPFACTITEVRLLADQSGSIVIDIWKDTYANYPPTDADTITASAVPTITTAVKSEDSTLTGWTTSVSVGDILGFNVDSITTIQRVVVSLTVDRV